MNNNPETYLLSHNRFIDYLVLIFATISNIIKYGFNDIKTNTTIYIETINLFIINFQHIKWL